MSQPLTSLTLAAVILTVAACSPHGPKAAKRFVENGDRYARRGDDKGAAIEYRNAIRESPDLVEAHSRLAEVSARLHDGATTAAELIALAELQPQDAAAQVRAGDAALSLGRMDDARRAFMAALTIDPASAEANRGIAVIDTASGRAREAEPYWKAVAASPKGDPFALADFYVAQRRLKDAERELRAALEVPERAAVARLRLAAIVFDLKKSQEADQLIDAALRSDHNAVGPWLLRGRMRVAERRLPEAKAAYTRALQADPASIEALAALTAVDMAAHNTTEAKERLEQRLAREPRAVPVLMLAAETYLGSGDDARAERTLLRVVEIDPDTVGAYNLLGQLYIRQGHLDAARAKFETIAARAPDPMPASTMVAMILDAQHRRNDARQRYEAILKTNRSAGVAANNLAWIYLEEGRHDEALQYALIAKNVLRRLPQASDTLGWVHYRMGKARDALPLLAECVELQPRNPLYRFHLGMAYLGAGMSARAREQLSEALATPVAFAGRPEAEQAIASLDASAHQ